MDARYFEDTAAGEDVLGAILGGEPVDDDGDYTEPVPAGDLAAVIAPADERPGLWGRATGPLVQLWGIHDWQPPALRDHLEATDPTDPYDRWVTRPAGHLLVRLYRLAHDRELARAVTVRLAAVALILTAIAVLLLTHKGA